SSRWRARSTTRASPPSPISTPASTSRAPSAAGSTASSPSRSPRRSARAAPASRRSRSRSAATSTTARARRRRRSIAARSSVSSDWTAAMAELARPEPVRAETGALPRPRGGGERHGANELSGASGAPAAEPLIRTRVGVALLGEQVVVHGRDLHRECLDLGFVHYLLFCVTGRCLDPARALVLERLWVATGYPDARIWCNRVAAYLGSARVDPGLAMSAAVAASNSTAYGFRA